MKIRLNGWQRLWLIASLLWIFSMGVMSAKYFQTESERRAWWLNMLELQLTTTIKGTDRTLNGGSRAGEKELEKLRGAMTDSEWIDALPKLYPNAGLQESLESYRRDMGNLPNDQLRDLGLIALLALVPPSLIYIAGLVLVWIIAGFRKPPRA